MRCPKCGGRTSVIDSRERGPKRSIVFRRRRCDVEACGGRFSTWESTASLSPQIKVDAQAAMLDLGRAAQHLKRALEALPENGMEDEPNVDTD